MTRARLICALVAATFVPSVAWPAFTGAGSNDGNRATAAPVFRPVNTAPPTISGTLREGSVLTASPGEWNRQPDTFTYAWERCNAQGLDCQPAGSPTPTYALTADDIDKTLRALVTARNAGGKAMTPSMTSAPIAMRELISPPQPTSVPTISGEPITGNTLTASSGTWFPAADSYSYQWLRCEPGGTCSAISSATARTYTLAGADERLTVRVQVTAQNAGGSRSSTSSALGPVGDAYQAAVRAPGGLVSYLRLDDPSRSSTFGAVVGPEGGRCNENGWTVDGTLGVNGNRGYYFTRDTCGRVARTIADDFSISFWFRTTAARTYFGDGRQWYMGSGLVDAEANGVTNDFGVSINGEGRVLAGVGNPDTTIASRAGYSDGAWHHVVFTRRRWDGLVELWIDGTLAAQGAGNTQSLDAPPHIILGAQIDGMWFEGALDEVAIYDTILTPAQIERQDRTGRTDQ